MSEGLMELCVYYHQLESGSLRDLSKYSWGDQELMGLKIPWAQPLQILHQCSELFAGLAHFSPNNVAKST